MTFLRKTHKFRSPFKLSLLFCALSPVAQAQSQYFNGRDIDYWNKGNKSQKEEEPDTNSFLSEKSPSPETTPTLSHSSPPSPTTIQKRQPFGTMEATISRPGHIGNLS
jgi:hypothetical protein